MDAEGRGFLSHQLAWSYETQRVLKAGKCKKIEFFWKNVSKFPKFAPDYLNFFKKF